MDTPQPKLPGWLYVCGLAIVIVFAISGVTWALTIVYALGLALLADRHDPMLAIVQRIFAIASASFLIGIGLIRLIVVRYPGHEMTPEKDASFRRIFILIAAISVIVLLATGFP